VFTLVRGLVGGTAIRAYSGVLTDPPLPDGAERAALRGDATAELPRVLSTAKEVLENLSAITAQDAALRNSLEHLQLVTARLSGPRGGLAAIFGNDADAQKLVAALDRTNALLARVDTLAAKADTQVFGPEGVMKEARATVVQLNGLLAETRESLKKLDAVLVQAQGIGADVKGATGDLGALRSDVEANLHKIEGLINELNRKWPFARDTEVKLP
jgi:phospholipid/cholesterol/gamma-HCH transport system substrate-binding protein